MTGYELIDSGDQLKLEKLGAYLIVRPEPLAVWKRKLSNEVWRRDLAAEYRAPRAKIGAGEWVFYDRKLQENPPVLSWVPKNRGDGTNESRPANNLPTDLRFQIQFMPSRHLGLFPEHEPQWQFIYEAIRAANATAAAAAPKSDPKDFHFLNLFGFTGAASLVAAAAGAQVTHIDSSYEAIGFGRHNQQISGLDSAPIRWIKEDVSKFIDRELKRHPHFYDGIIFDPPAHGHGARKGETWHLTSMLPDLVKKLSQLLSPRAQFLILNTYTDVHFSRPLQQASTLGVPEVFAPLCATNLSHHQSGNLFLPQTSQPNRPLILSRFNLFTPPA